MFLKETKYTNPTYICDKCGVKISYRPKRIAIQDHKSHYGHQTIKYYDLCNKHYEIFINWMNGIK